MTDEMTVQAQKPMTMPYAIGGAAVGALGGGALSKWGNIGIPGKAYSSWEDVVKDVDKDDKFVTEAAKKENDAASAWKEVEQVRKDMKEAESAYKTAVPEALREEITELDDYAKKLTEHEEAVAKYDKKVDSYLDDLIKDSWDHPVKLGDKFEDKAHTLVTEEGEHKGKYVWKGENGEISVISKEDIKNRAKQIIDDGDQKGVFRNKDLRTVMAESEELKAKNAAEEALGKSKETLENKFTKLNENISENKLSVDKAKSYIEGKKNYKAAREGAEKKLTTDILDKCKKPKVVLTALVGAAALGLLGALIAPKGDKA